LIYERTKQDGKLVQMLHNRQKDQAYCMHQNLGKTPLNIGDGIS